MTWNCPQCDESIDRHFDVCWTCGTRRDGSPDPDFQHADSYLPPLLDERPRYSLSGLFRVVTAVCLMIPFFRLAVSGLPDLFVILIGTLAVGAFGYLAILVMSWLITRWVERWQRRVRAGEAAASRRHELIRSGAQWQ